MRTSSPLHSRKEWSWQRYVVIGISLVVLVGFFFTRPIRSTASYLMAPLYGLKVWINGAHDPVSAFFHSRLALEAKIHSLQQSLRDAEYDGARLKILEEESTQKTRNADRIAADVVKTPNETPYDTLLINKGTDDDIQDGALAFAGNTAIGKVVRVYAQSSLVMLFSTPEVQSPAYIYGANVFARATGVGAGVIKVSVPQGVKLAVGNPVVVPIADTDIYGSIEYIESDPSNPEQYGYITQTHTLTSLRTIWIAREAPPPMSFKEALYVVDSVRASSTYEGLIRELPLASSTASSTLP